MKSLHLRAHVDAQGILTLTMPPEMAGQDVDLVVVFEPVALADTTTPQTTAAKGWPSGFFEEVVGGWQGEPLVREYEGDYEQREPLE
jgi:hypothetical protein